MRKKTKAGVWQAGLSRVDITPTEPIWLHGWGQSGNRAKPSQGVSQKIYAKSLALQDETGQIAVWVTADLLGYSRDMANTLAKRAQKKFGLERSRLILNSSHNHSGPATGDLLHLYFDLPSEAYKVIKRYTAWLLDRIIESIGLAIDDLKPASLSFGQGLAGFGVNRRRSRPGGRSLPTVVDQDVPVLTVRSLRGELRGIVFGYSCHTTTIENGQVNGDYAGYAQEELEAMHPGAIALFVAGCGGDINPLPRFHEGIVEAYGHILAVAVAQVLDEPMKPVNGPLKTAFSFADLPLEKIPPRSVLEAHRSLDDPVQQRAVEYQLAVYERKGKLPLTVPYAIQVWQFGNDLKLIALAGEPVVDYALRFKETYGWEDTWVSGYNDELTAYIPTRRVRLEGGYEGVNGMLEYGLGGAFTPAIEETIATGVRELVQQTSDEEESYAELLKR